MSDSQTALGSVKDLSNMNTHDNMSQQNCTKQALHCLYSRLASLGPAAAGGLPSLQR